MTKSQRMWLRAARLLSDTALFHSERERVLDEHPLLNSHGLGQSRRPKKLGRGNGSGAREHELVPANLIVARDELRSGGLHESGIRNTLEYLAEARVSLSYRLRGCAWARRSNGPAPAKRSSYALKQEAEMYLRQVDGKRATGPGSARIDRYISNGAFVCGSLMAGMRMWTYRDSVNPDFRLGKPWAVAGIQPQDFTRPRDERMAGFWRWVVQHEIVDTAMEEFIADLVDALYRGADLETLNANAAAGDRKSAAAYDRLRREFGLETGSDSNATWLGFMSGEIRVPDDFDRFGQTEIIEMFEGSD